MPKRDIFNMVANRIMYRYVVEHAVSTTPVFYQTIGYYTTRCEYIIKNTIPTDFSRETMVHQHVLVIYFDVFFRWKNASLRSRFVQQTTEYVLINLHFIVIEIALWRVFFVKRHGISVENWRKIQLQLKEYVLCICIIYINIIFAPRYQKRKRILTPSKLCQHLIYSLEHYIYINH